MNYFNGKTNDHFVKFFLDELYSKTEFIQFNDPDDFFDPEQEYGKHIQESKEKLFDFILNATQTSIEDFSPELENALDEKTKELYKILNPEIEIYISKVKVDYR